MKRFLCCIFALSFASLAHAQDAPPEVYYIPGMPVPPVAAPETATNTGATPARTPAVSGGKISKVSVAGAKTSAQTVSMQPVPATSQAAALDSDYGGVTPPKNVVPDNAQNFAGSKNQVAWIGFQPARAQHSVFIQTTVATPFEEIERSDRRVVIHLPNTALLVSNNARELDMRYFNTPFASAKASRFGKGARVVVEFKEKTVFDIVSHDNFIEIRTVAPTLKSGGNSEAQ